MVKFGKVALLYGGTSAEREVSLASGQAVYEALCARGVQVELVDSQDHRRVLNLREEGFNGAFIALHGRGGEDGQIQAILEWQGLPYTGAGVLACALAMDKVLTKKIWASSGLPVQRDWVLDASTSYEFLVAELGAKRFAVKPALEGSSVGISAVASEEQLREAYEKAGGAREKIMAEPWIKGRELTCAIIGERVLPTVEIATGAGHQFSHVWEMEGHGLDWEPPLSHGFKVGVGTVASCAIWEEFLKMEAEDFDVDRALAAVKSPEQVESQVRAALKPRMQEEAVRHSLKKRTEGEELVARIELLKEKWPELRERLRAQLMAPEEVMDRLKTVGAPYHPELIEIDWDRFRETHFKAQMIRDRYTVFDILIDLGVYDAVVEKLFSPEGFWGRHRRPAE